MVAVVDRARVRARPIRVTRNPDPVRPVATTPDLDRPRPMATIDRTIPVLKINGVCVPTKCFNNSSASVSLSSPFNILLLFSIHIFLFENI